MSPVVKVLVVEDDALVREAVARALNGEPDLEVVAAGSHGDPFEDVANTTVDAVVVRVQPGVDVSSAVAHAVGLQGAARIVVMATYIDDELTASVRAQGGHVVGTAEPYQSLLAAVRGVDVVDAPIAEANDPELRAVARATKLGLTPRQHEVLRMLAAGRTPQQVARQLDIAVSTARGHVKSLHRIFDCTSTVELVGIAYRSGVVPELGRPLP